MAEYAASYAEALYSLALSVFSLYSEYTHNRFPGCGPPSRRRSDRAALAPWLWAAGSDPGKTGRPDR